MAQSRFWISTHNTFKSAKEAKDRKENDNPEATFQIRKGEDKGREVFRLVQRFKNNEAKVVTEGHISTKRGKRAKKRSTVDTSWLTGKS